MQELINVNIRPHLISFLFQELQGETQAVYGGKKVKLAKFSRSSILGNMIEDYKASAGQVSNSRLNSFSIFLTIAKSGEKQGLFHEKHDSTHKVLQLLPKHVLIINEFFENIFRISAVEFIKGYTKGSDKHRAVEAAVHQFMLDHDLYATEIDPASLKAHYYKSLKKKHSLSRIQNQIGNRSLYFHSA